MTAEIFDRGYRRYVGQRTGLQGAARTLVTHSIQRSLGLHRSARHKIIPFTLIAFAFVPATIFLGIAAFLPAAAEADAIPNYSDYYGLVASMLFLFISFVAPDLLCNDRRTGMLGVYLASPLNRSTYLLAKTAAVVTLMLIITLLPNLLFFAALSLQGFGPGGVFAVLKVLGQIVLSAVVIAAFFTAVGMAVSATTDRKGTATAATLGTFVGSAAIAGLLVDGLGYSPHLRLINLIATPMQLAPRIFGETSPDARP
ncbi:MAG: ABC transporter permease [Acidimicrobiales bacterium]